MKIAYLDDLRKLADSIAAKVKKQFIAKSNLDSHNTSSDSHEDIREFVSTLTNRLNALVDSDDETLDQLSEIVAYIKDNRELIDSITTSKVSVSAIVDNLTSIAENKPLSANQGRVLKGSIDELQSSVEEDIEDLKKSVSDGKELVADAITEKGIDTAADATFATIAENIGQIETGSDITLQESVTVKSNTNANGKVVFPNPGYDAISKVIVEPIKLESTYVKSNMIKNAAAPTLRLPSEGYDGFSSVSVENIRVQEITVEPTEEEQIILPSEGYDALSKVVVGAASSSGITMCEELGSTTNLTTIPEGYKAYVFLWITAGLESTTIVRYGTNDSPGFLLHKSGKVGSGNAKACYSLNIFDGSIGGSAKIKNGFSCYGLK